MKFKCDICGFENDIRYGSYCVRFRGALNRCTGDCRECLKKINSDCKFIKDIERSGLNDTSTA